MLYAGFVEVVRWENGSRCLNTGASQGLLIWTSQISSLFNLSAGHLRLLYMPQLTKREVVFGLLLFGIQGLLIVLLL